MDLAVTVNFKINEFHLHVHNNIQIQQTRLATCSTNDGDNKDEDHSWTLVDEHFFSSATLTKTETKTDLHVPPWPVTLLLGLLQLASGYKR